MTTGILVFGPDNVAREGLRRILDGDEFTVRVSSRNPFGILGEEEKYEGIEIIILYYELFKTRNKDIWGGFRDKFPDSRIVVISDRFDFDGMAELFRLGIDGFILDKVRYEVLINYLRSIKLGEKVMPSDVAELLWDHSHLKSFDPVSNNKFTGILSDRECETFRHMVKGMPNKVIAREMGTTEATIKVYVKAILRKLHLQNRTQAVAWAYETSIDHTAESTPAKETVANETVAPAAAKISVVK